ncbi:STAS domain-containing protein [Streptomyces sp.]|uniref:STAS domain-containing protein n=1 Tax=Streptomyces sp. TaxID=1931 RepID=UPI002D77EEC7|nr:STAS domain-containing protein [Streptomyces sp.]HET6354824.1 STAS domain-containing protein [Streptomyces sp.]
MDAVGAEPLVRTAELRISRIQQPPGLRIEGIVDVHTHRHLSGALDMIASVEGDLQLDVSGLEFLDLGGLRLLIGLARTRKPGDHVELAGLAPHLRNVIALVGWDDTPGLRLGDHRVN